MGKKSGFELHQGMNVILFGVDGAPLEPPTGNRQQQRREMKRRAKEMEKVIKEHEKNKESGEAHRIDIKKGSL